MKQSRTKQACAACRDARSAPFARIMPGQMINVNQLGQRNNTEVLPLCSSTIASSLPAHLLAIMVEQKTARPSGSGSGPSGSFRFRPFSSWHGLWLNLVLWALAGLLQVQALLYLEWALGEFGFVGPSRPPIWPSCGSLTL